MYDCANFGVAIVGGIIITKTGYVAAVAVAGAVLATICCGLIYTLDIGSSSGKWIGYQIIGGSGEFEHVRKRPLANNM